MANLINYLKNTISFDELENNLEEVIDSVEKGDFKLIIHNNEVKVMMISVKEYEQLKKLGEKTKIGTKNDINIESKLDNVNIENEVEIKVGNLVKMGFNYVEKKQLLTGTMINKLSDLEYSKAQFGISYSLLKPINNTEPLKQQLRGSKDDKYSRYWSKIYVFNGKEYCICSQWYERNKERFINWCRNNLDLNPSDYL